jgi:hypothetical protein
LQQGKTLPRIRIVPYTHQLVRSYFYFSKMEKISETNSIDLIVLGKSTMEKTPGKK